MSKSGNARSRGGYRGKRSITDSNEMFVIMLETGETNPFGDVLGQQKGSGETSV
jgi:hypothetical protein